MKHITHESILKAIDLIDNLDDNQFSDQLSNKEENQPILLGYLLSAAEEYENEMLEGLILYYFSLIIEAFKNEGVEISQVTEEQIDTFQEPFHEMLDDYFDTDNEFDYEKYKPQRRSPRLLDDRSEKLEGEVERKSTEERTEPDATVLRSIVSRIQCNGVSLI